MTNDTAMTKQESEVMIEQLKKVFEVVRLLDVDTLEMGNLKGVEDVDGFPCKCYDFWKKGTRCKNCTSREALQKKEKVLKLEYLNSNIYQVISKYIEIDGKPYVIELINAMKSDAIMDDDGRTELIKQLSGYNRELYTDALTGIYNRRYYEERIKNSDMTAGIAMIDLDDFKIYNDTFGHDAGDLALTTVVGIVKANVRRTDMLIRMGGDEFLLVMPDITDQIFADKLKQIQEKIHDTKVPGYSQLRLSVSIGGVLSAPGSTVENAIHKADQFMYQAKTCKNMVVTEHDEEVQDNAEGGETSKTYKYRILIVDDSEMNRAILSEILSEEYDIVEADSGESCIDKLRQYEREISLVLLDIVMPGMSGIELCRKIKENSRTSAIGVILLTAHNLQNYEVSGYRVGADAYVAKPFSLEVLFSRIDNLVARQNKIHKNSQPIKEIPISEVAVEKSEDLFLVKCTETIETEIADPRFDVLQLCRKIGVSRSQLYRRILALTGLTPIQFIRSIRLKHAASFLAQDGTLPVNEVMYRVGYTNLSHFAKIFHEEFGLYPKEFALRNRSKTGKVDSASEIFSKNEPETQK